MSCRVVVLAAAFTFGTFGLAPAADEKADDNKALQGTWVYESLEWQGKKFTADQIKSTTITFDGDKVTMKIGDKVTMSGTFKVDSTKSPKAIDFTVTEGEGKGNVLLGIYKFDGETITTCMNLGGTERPKEFKSTEVSGTTVAVARRKK
jgi:uncharacterized protein (TIGR03067 family)